MRVWHPERVPGLFFFLFFGCSPGTYVSTYTADTTLVHTQFQQYVYWYPATRYIRAVTRYARILVFSPVKRRLLAKKFARTRVNFFGGILDVALYCTYVPGTILRSAG